MANFSDIKFKITRQGDVKMSNCQGYDIYGGDNALCFYIDPTERACVNWSYIQDGIPTISVGLIKDDEKSVDTEIQFPTLIGWRFHCGGAGKSIALSFVKEI